MKNYVITTVLGAAIGGFLVYKLRPPEMVTKEITKDHVVTVVKTVTAKDGTTETTSTTTQDKRVDAATKTVPSLTASSRSLWEVGVGYNTDKHYYGYLNRQVLGPVYVGISATQNGTLGAHLGVQF